MYFTTSTRADKEDCISCHVWPESLLDHTLSNIPKVNKIFLQGDFHARIGRDTEKWSSTIGNESTEEANSNEILLLTKWAKYDLVITNIRFHQCDQLMTSCAHPCSKHRYFDYIIVSSKDCRDVHVTRVKPRSDHCWTDHQLIRAVVAARPPEKRHLQRAQCQV